MTGLAQICLPEDAGNMSKTQLALKIAQHELITLNGLVAFDDAAPQKTFRIDTCEAARFIEEALTELSDT